MNSKSYSSLTSRRDHEASRRGMALLLVLACLVLLATMILGIMISAQNNLRSSKLYADGSSVKTLADSAVNIVMAQIQQATSNGTTVAWASQPGMIRTYSNTGLPLNNYRLFSWDTPTISGTYDPSTDFSQFAAAATNPWSSSPAIFVDLNQPQTDANGTLHYPILDGNPADLANYTNPAGQTVQTYMVSSKPMVEGFWVNTSQMLASANNSIPMPVKWLYVLQNGTLVAPVASASGTQAQVNGATPTNPIIGRIAYWTDDETSKVNINTASEGNYWDTPRAQGVTDFNLASFQPVTNEFQRYPGHPAMTCLSSVLGSLFPVDHTLEASNSEDSYNSSSATTVYTPYIPYYDLAPKLNLDMPSNLGSQAGTTVAYTTSTGTPILPLTSKTDRLYNNVDELIFKSNLIADSAHSTSWSGSRPNTNASITESILEKVKFFLTANSRAPDVNLFNQPRVVTWPVNATNDDAHRTPYDQTIAFCGTINQLPYYFQRSRSDHPTNDLPATAATSGLGRNRSLIQYLQNLTSQNVPGFGGKFSDKYPVTSGVSERDQILTEMFDYIRCLNLNDQSTAAMTSPFAPAIAALGGNAGFGEVVPIYDTVNKTKGFGRFPTIQEVSIIFIATGWNDGLGGKTSDINYQGMTAQVDTGANTGSYYLPTPPSTASTPAPWGYYNSTATGSDSKPYPLTNPLKPTPNHGTNLTTIPNGNIQVQAALVISYFDPSQGNVVEGPSFNTQVIGLDGFTWGGVTPTSGPASTMGFPSGANAQYQIGNGANTLTQEAGGNLGFRNAFAGAELGQSVGSSRYYPFVSTVKNFPYTPGSSSPGTFSFSGGTITINLVIPNTTPSFTIGSNAQNVVQSISVTFPSATLPLPTYAPPAQTATQGGMGNWNPFSATQVQYELFEDRGDLNNRFNWVSSTYAANAEFTWGADNGTQITQGDVVRSIRAYPGDMRIVAGQSSIDTSQASPTGYFDDTQTKIPASGLAAWQYSDSTARQVHSLTESVNYPFYGAILGQLVPGLQYFDQPAIAGRQQILNGGPVTNVGGVYGYSLNNFCGAGNNASGKGAFIGGGLTGIPGDWDNGTGSAADGPYINKADEGNFNAAYGQAPYFYSTTTSNNSTFSSYDKTFFSPNRLMPGPGMFGSLSTGVAENIPWRTLLFCPAPAGGASHPGFGVGSGTAGPTDVAPYSKPPDHLLLDLFNMPVVEPYPITEPLSTAGRINMNYQIVPFTNIERSTGLRAVLKAERMIVIPDSVAGAYKWGSGGNYPADLTHDYRAPINSDQTLLAFDNFFSTTKDIFRSASQICNMFLYPTRDAVAPFTATNGPLWDSANANILKFWNGNTTGGSYSVSTNATSPTHYLTGDNSRERPYTTIYPRLTTKSNTFTVHYYVQTLKQALPPSTPAAAWQTWREGTDQITGQYRGSTTIERYVDPNDTSLPDFTAAANVNTALDQWYKFRVISNTQFAP